MLKIKLDIRKRVKIPKFVVFSKKLVNGGWGNWRIVSVDHCKENPNGEVKLIRLCDNPVPRHGGNLCPDPDYNERHISCNDTNYEGNTS